MILSNLNGIRQVTGTIAAAKQSQVVIQCIPIDPYMVWSVCGLDPAVSGRTFDIYFEYGIFPGATVPKGAEFAEFDNGADLVMSSRFPAVGASGSNRLQAGPSAFNRIYVPQPFFVWFWDSVAVGSRPANLNYCINIFRGHL